jgi:hypothetical protein
MNAYDAATTKVTRPPPSACSSSGRELGEADGCVHPCGIRDMGNVCVTK